MNSSGLALELLGFVPEHIELSQPRVRRIHALLVTSAHDVTEAPLEFAVGRPQSALGLDAELGAEAHEHEQQVAEFLGDRLLVALCDRLLELGPLLARLLQWAVDIGPVEANTSSLVLQPPRSLQSRQRLWHAGERVGDVDIVIWRSSRALGL